jgi:cytochrome c1
MKKLLFVLIALVAVFAFATGAVAAEKKATKPQVAKVSGTVNVYIAAGQMEKTKGTITVKDAKSKDWTFDVSPDTKVTGEVKRGAKATVTYSTEGRKMTATAISAAAAKKDSKPATK